MKRTILTSIVVGFAIASTIWILYLITNYAERTHERLIFYNYKGVTVTRLVKATSSNFYYGKIEDGNYPDSYIHVEGNFNADLEFMVYYSDEELGILPNGKVVIAYTSDKFTIVNKTTNFSLIQVTDSIFNDYDHDGYYCSILSDIDDEFCANKSHEVDIQSDFSQYESSIYNYFYPIISLFRKRSRESKECLVCG